MHRSLQLVCALLCTLAALAFPAVAAASPYHGQITFQGWPVPGATVTVTLGTKSVPTVSDQAGLYNFADLPDGSAKIKIEMQGFSTIEADLTIAANTPAGKWELTLLPLDQIADMARAKLAPGPIPTVSSEAAAKKPAGAESSNGTVGDIA
jgi:hypothetical protein